MKIVDLHVHSNKSDGSLTPSELVDLAAAKGLSAFALTDHDTTAGLDEAIAYAQKLTEKAVLHAGSGQAACPGIRVIPGIEFSTEYQGKDIHILGLAIDHRQPEFNSRIQAFVDSRILRNQKMCQNLEKAGIDISYEKLTAAFPGSVITRGHYARYLLEHGYVRSMPEAFERYVGDRCPYFVPREKVTPWQAVELILQARGIPVLAHPVLYRMGRDTLQRLTARLKEAGLVGIEAVYSTYSQGEERQMRELAARNGLLISGGSDFHGANKPGLELATGYNNKLVIPYDIWEKLEARQKEIFSPKE